MQLKKLESIDSGSNYKFNDSTEVAQNPRSMFDLSHVVTTTMNNSGSVEPVSWFKGLPLDDHDVTGQCLVRVMPQVVPLYTRQRQYIYAICSRAGDLYKNFQVFETKGRTGTTVKHLPYFTDDNLIVDTETPSLVIQPGSLGDKMGLPIGMTRAQVIGAHIDMLPFMMILRFWRDYLINPNLRASDTVLFPDDDGDFRLDDEGLLISAEDNNVHCLFDIFTTTKGIDYDLGGNLIVRIPYHEYPSDRFTTALLSPTRGTEPTLNYEANSNIDFKNVFARTTDSSVALSNIDGFILSSNELKLLPQDSDGNLSKGNYGDFIDTFNQATLEKLSLKITLNDLRELSINQTILEKLAKTDGSYSQFGLAMYGEAPNDASSYKPLLIGTTYHDITFTEVLQTAPTTKTVDDKTVTTPLGATGGHGIGFVNDNYLGHVHCTTHSYIMILSCIMPDVYYFQGLDKKFTDVEQEDMFLPEKSKLGMIPILNKELFYAGNNGTSAGDDNYLFGYGNIYDEYRYMPNKISGKIADQNNESFFPFTQARVFESLPNLGTEFVTANDVRKDYLASAEEDAYSLNFYFNIRSVRQLPYQARPAALI